MAKRTKVETEAKKPYISPIIRFDGDKHDLEKLDLEDPESMPELKAVGYMKIGEKNHSWVSYTITTKGREVVSLEVSEPDMREIAEESAKIAFVQNFTDQEF